MSTTRTSTASIRLAINGARGRMGTRLCALARDDGRFAVVATIDPTDDDGGVCDRATAVDLVIDFSSDAGARDAAALARDHDAALLVGTTALAPDTTDTLRDLARSVPVMVAPNVAAGVAVLTRIARDAAAALGEPLDVDLVETHHAGKRDQPSGTALRLAQTLRRDGVRLPDERIHSIRLGDVIGEHTVHLAAPGERLVITHVATSRDLFARGALRAGAWLVQQRPGLYAIEDSLER